jgi:recombination DNA repair RAD52 pathway protein
MTHTPAPTFDVDRIQPLTNAQQWQLMQSLPNERVKQLKGMSYVEAWDVKATLTRVFGFGGFSTQILHEELMFAEQVARSGGSGTNWSVGYKVSLRLIIPQLGVFFDEAAVGSNSQGSRAEATDNAVKGATSDALKRCATMLGTQFGLSLYDNGNQQEVIKTIVAPGQEWIRGARPVKKGEQQEEPRQQERPASAAASVEHLRGEGVDDAAHAQNMEHLNNALSAQVKRQRERSGPDVPGVLDTSLDGDPDADLHNPMDASEGIPAR